MPTTPEQVRHALQLVTAAAIAEVEAVSNAYADPTDKVSALFAATPLIVGDYLDGSSTLALDWYEELRDLSKPTKAFSPRAATVVRDGDIGNAVAWATEFLRDYQANALADVDVLSEEMLKRLTPVVQREVAAGLWDSITENVKKDPDAVGWQRFSRPDACPFCRMLADKGAVYRSDETARFAAHKKCHCVAAPKFKGNTFGDEADVMQYMASEKHRSDADKARLRDYLKAHYGA